MVVEKRRPRGSSQSDKKASIPETEEEKKYTPEQSRAVKEILAYGTDHYKILNVKNDCTEVEIKKSYRKLALQFHPDKNRAPDADEAFKRISKAFTVLSDPQKRAIHDAGGSDQDMRHGGAGPAFPGYGFNPRPGQEISPEDLFNMFFGGSASGFGPTGFSSATFVGPGFRTHTFSTGGNAGRRHPFPNGQSSNNNSSNMNGSTRSGWTVLLQLLPLLVLFGYSVLSGLLTDNTKAFSLQSSNYYSQSRMTNAHKVPYFVNPSSFRSTAQSAYKLSRTEQQVEMDWVRGLQHTCQKERHDRRMRLNAASGIFGIGRDEEKYQQALRTPLTSCDEIERFGYSVDY